MSRLRFPPATRSSTSTSRGVNFSLDRCSARCAATSGGTLFREHKPDVTLMDLRLPDLSGIDVMIAIRQEFPEARVVMLTTFEGDVEIQRALQAGAQGYLLKSMPPSEMVKVIRHVHAGKKRVPPEVAAHLAEHISDEGLTPREVQVLERVAGGNRNKDIAGLIYIS